MKRFLILFLLSFLSGMTAFAQINLQQVAVVNLTRSEAITVRQLRMELERLAWQQLVPNLGRPPTTEEINRMTQNIPISERRQVLDVMINQRLALQAAERDRVTVTDNELNQMMAMLRNDYAQGLGRQPTEEEFAAAIRNETGQDLPAFRDSLRRNTIAERYLVSQKQEMFNNIREPTEAEIVNFYNLSRARFVRDETIRFSMILVPYGPDAASRTRARELAERLNREIGTNSARFDEAVLRGQSPNSGYQAGDFGYIPRNMGAQQMMGTDFMNIAFSLNQGEVSRIIEGPQGFKIIKVTETLPQRNLELDDIFQPGTRITVRQFIAGNMLQQRQQETIARAMQELITELRAAGSVQVMENNLNW
jgi:parvulin-like peptidyl-prolyl isomerase